MENQVLKIVYTFFLDIIITLFVGLGIRTFYAPPEPPQFPSAQITKANPTDQELAEQLKQQEAYERAFRAYDEQNSIYNRNVSTISLVASVVLLGLSLLLEKRNRVLANGILLGGLFTLLYSIGRGFASQDTLMTFLAVSVGLAVALFLGYRRFFDKPTAAPAAGLPEAGGPGSGAGTS
jgi:lipopolysaccharide export LptBFGC system permease protein LptF